MDSIINCSMLLTSAIQNFPSILFALQIRQILLMFRQNSMRSIVFHNCHNLSVTLLARIKLKVQENGLSKPYSIILIEIGNTQYM